jgi:arginyl-tRNA synthetase
MPLKFSSFLLKIENLVEYLLEKNSKIYQNISNKFDKCFWKKNTLDRNENEVAFECDIYHRCVVTKT